MATFSLDGTLDIGEEIRTIVAEDCQTPNRFSGAIKFVQIDSKLDGKIHYLTPEQRFRIAMGRQ